MIIEHYLYCAPPKKVLGSCKFIKPLVKINIPFVHPFATSIIIKVNSQAIYPRLYMSNIIKQTKKIKFAFPDQCKLGAEPCGLDGIRGDCIFDQRILEQKRCFNLVWMIALNFFFYKVAYVDW